MNGTISIAGSIPPKYRNLEEEFIDQICCDVDVHAKRDYHFLIPNENPCKPVQKHLNMADVGILVSVGTERVIRNLILGDEKKLLGAVGRDLDPQVKAYMDCLVLLLRISSSREEFVELSQGTRNKESILRRIHTITEKIKQSEITDRIKRYYLENIKKFAPIYLAAREDYSTRYFRPAHPKVSDGGYPQSDYTGPEYTDCVNYEKDDLLFAKLQRYAKAGNIISTIGNINDLSFLESRVISVVDTSNVADYSYIDLEGKGDFRPRVISTQVWHGPTFYYSYIHEPLSDEERREYEDLLQKIRQNSTQPVDFNWIRDNLSCECYKERFNASPGASYSKGALNRLRNYVAESIAGIPGIT